MSRLLYEIHLRMYLSAAAPEDLRSGSQGLHTAK
jgi:hypothetical protein